MTLLVLIDSLTGWHGLIDVLPGHIALILGLGPGGGLAILIGAGNRRSAMIVGAGGSIRTWIAVLIRPGLPPIGLLTITTLIALRGMLFAPSAPAAILTGWRIGQDRRGQRHTEQDGCDRKALAMDHVFSPGGLRWPIREEGRVERPLAAIDRP